MSKNAGNNKNDKIKIPFKKVMEHNFFMVKIIFSASPLYGVMLIINSLREQGMNFIEHTFGIGFVLETVEYGREFTDVLHFLLFMFGLMALSGLFSSVFLGVVAPIYRPVIERSLKLKLYEKARELDLSCYDDPYYYNEFVLAVSESKNSLDRSIKWIEMVFQALVMFFSYGTFFLVKDPLSVVFVLVSFIARLIISGIVNKLGFRARIAENPFIRKRNYIHRVFYLNDYAKELRLNKHSSKSLYEDFDQTNDEIIKIRKSVAHKKWILYFLTDYLFRDFITDGIFLTYLVFKAVVKKAMSFSTLVVMYNSAGSLRRSMAVLSDIYPYAMETALYVEKIRTFLDYETKIISKKNLKPAGKPPVICFENVSFAYSEKDKAILNNINLTIKPNERIALVGYNGAGKTTLVKLLMRLYDPTEGRITMDGIDIRDYSVEEYRERIGTIFQDYRIYAATVLENIIMNLSDQQNINGEKIQSALYDSGFKEKSDVLENNVNTQLTREFDENGTSLSGGESQKLATARVFYKESDIIILDEPSSALDPIAEYQLNHSMSKAAKEKSVVFISHRLSTTRHADRIIMLENGRIIEQGTHDQLLVENRKYANMWRAQASKYS